MPSARAWASTNARGTPCERLRWPVSSNIVSRVAARTGSSRAYHNASIESLPPLDEQSAFFAAMELTADEIDIAILAAAHDARLDVEHTADHFTGERARDRAIALDA